MEEEQDGDKKARRIFTAEQKFEILKEIERCKTIKEGLPVEVSRDPEQDRSAQLL